MPAMGDPARWRRILPYVAVGAVALYLFHVASGIEYHARPGVLGPAFWPKLVLGLALATCALEIGRIALFGGRGAAREEEPGEFAEAAPQPGAGSEPALRPLALLAGIALTALYVYALPRVGFALATAPYLAAFIALGGYRRWGAILAVSTLGTLVMMFFFMRVVYISLPIGLEPFDRVMILLMKLMGIR
jgi:putative tricarboxylic transport membrane protein